MKKIIYILLLFILILSTSCLPTKSETVKEKMEGMNYKVEVYTKDKYNLKKMEEDFGYHDINTVINAFKYHGENIDSYVNIIIFDNKTSAKEAYNKICDQKENGDFKDQTLEIVKIKGTWIYYGSTSAVKDLEK